MVLEVKGLKQDYIFKNRPFYISFDLFHSEAGLNILSKKVSKINKISFLPTLDPNFFRV